MYLAKNSTYYGAILGDIKTLLGYFLAETSGHTASQIKVATQSKQTHLL
jgi:hypothetical protein